jgi:hypothetical protein
MVSFPFSRRIAVDRDARGTPGAHPLLIRKRFPILTAQTFGSFPGQREAAVHREIVERYCAVESAVDLIREAFDED